ncbi:MAG: sensor histidine kinase [Acidimicrobiia bacterium]
MSLRARLTLGLVALSAVALLLTGVATFGALRSFLFERVDDQLSAAFRRPAISARSLPAGGYFEVRRPNGDVVQRQDASLLDDAPPDLPANVPLGPFTADAAGDGPQYRVAAERGGGGNTIVIALPLDEVHRTLRRLVLIEIVVMAIALGALGALGWWLVGLGLRPLERMSDTAGKIAAGDLSQRVEPANEQTEVGRLGIALNRMLGQIEGAFAERSASEARLRQFAADASHELRTPLTSIRGYAELFRRGAAEHPDDLAKAMRRIEEEAKRMGVLVDDLLLLTRLDQRRPLEQEVVDLARLASDAAADARAAHPDHTITVSVAGAVEVVGDESRLRQVFANLLTNACTHTPDGTTVRVGVVRNRADAVIEVADDGPGLSADEAVRVFEQFWRADTSRARSHGGSGLGLSIVRAVAHAHGGTAELVSAPGEGATFRVTVPA